MFLCTRCLSYGDARCHVSSILISGRDGRLDVVATYRTVETYPFPNPTPEPMVGGTPPVPDLFDHQWHEVSRMCCCLSALGGALERIVPWVPSLPPWPMEMRWDEGQGCLFRRCGDMKSCRPVCELFIHKRPFSILRRPSLSKLDRPSYLSPQSRALHDRSPRVRPCSYTHAVLFLPGLSFGLIVPASYLR